MLRDSVSAMEFSQPVCTITAVSKDLVRRPTRISYDLSLATLSHELGCLLADSGTIRRKLLDQLRTPSMFVLRSMRKHPRDFWRTFSVIIVNRSGKAIDNTQGRASRLSSSGVPFAGLQPVPAAATGLRSSPRSKRMTRPCASRTLLSSCLRGQCRLTLWGTLDARAEPTWPRPGLFVDRSYVPCAGQRYCAGH